jgi:hypothetical protein
MKLSTTPIPGWSSFDVRHSIKRLAVPVQSGVLFLIDLQVLQALARCFVDAMLNSTKKMPYGMQCIAREILHELRVRTSLTPVAS